MSEAEQLADLADIHRLKAQYFRFLDTKAWADWRQLFSDDLVFYMDDSALPDTAAAPVTVGGDEFVEYVSALLSTAVTVHQGHMPEIAFTSATTATGIWAMFDWVDNADQGSSLQGYGHYHERYVKADGRWRIAELRLTRLRVDALTPTRPAGRRPWPPAWSRANGQPQGSNS